MKKENSKSRVLALLQLLMEQSDLLHPLSMPTIISTLETQGYPCERKAIYDDFKALSKAGIEVEFIRTPRMGYVLSERFFETVDLKILMDAVDASSFLTQKKTKQIKEKLLRFATIYEKEALSVELDAPKSSNEQILYSIDTLLEAISTKKKIRFTYFDIGLDKKRHYRRQKKIYQGDPYALLWENKAYYLLFKMDSHDNITQYRVDKMDQLECTELSFEPKPFDLKQYRMERIGMYSGEKVNITLEFIKDDRLVSLLYDQFGEDFLLIKQNDTSFTVNINTSISPTLMGWLATLNTQVKIVKPQSLIDSYQNYLTSILKQYRKDEIHESD